MSLRIDTFVNLTNLQTLLLPPTASSSLGSQVVDGKVNAAVDDQEKVGDLKEGRKYLKYSGIWGFGVVTGY